MKIFNGVVVSKKMEKTATVLVSRVFVHPVYKKRIKRVKKYQVDDQLGVNVSDRVNFVATKPISKTKRWRITKVLGDKTKDSKKVSGKPKKRSKK